MFEAQKEANKEIKIICYYNAVRQYTQEVLKNDIKTWKPCYFQDKKGGISKLFDKKEFLNFLSRERCHGLCNHKENEIYLLVLPQVKLSNLIHLIAHERGHLFKPHYSTEEKNEDKAECFGLCAKFAFDLANEISPSTLRQSRKGGE